MSEPRLRAGAVYRTEDFGTHTRNPTRLVARLVEQRRLRRLRKGLYYAPRRGALGDVPPSETELLRAFFRGRRYLVTGPTVWNRLGLGSTSVEATPLVYNTTRSGVVDLGGRSVELRRVSFPRSPNPEFFVVDLLENCARAGTSPERVCDALRAELREGSFDAPELRRMATRYGTAATRAIVDEAMSPEPSYNVPMLEETLDNMLSSLRACLVARPEILEAYLFGSHARGDSSRHSDLDVAVFVGDSSTASFPYGYLSDLAADLVGALQRNDIDVVLLNRAAPLLYQRVLRDGIRVLSRDLAATTVREGRALSRYCDYVPQLRKIEALHADRIERGSFGR